MTTLQQAKYLHGDNCTLSCIVLTEVEAFKKNIYSLWVYNSLQWAKVELPFCWKSIIQMDPAVITEF